jgi:putative ABC transport system permease protein
MTTVSAAWFQFRVACARRWRTWALIGAVAGIAGGVVMVAVAGARRTGSSLARVVREDRAADVLVNPNNGSLSEAQWQRLEHLPEVAAYARMQAAPMATLTPSGHLDAAWFESVHSVLTFENPDGFELRTIDRPGIIAGRLPPASDLHAIVINETAAREHHLQVGSTLRVGFFDLAAVRNPESLRNLKPKPYTLRVAAIVRPLEDATRTADDPRLSSTVVLTQSLSRRIAHLGSAFGGLSVRLSDRSRFAEFERHARAIAGSNVLDFQEVSGTLQRGRRAIRPYVLALWLFALLALLAGAAAVSQIVTRQQRIEATSRPVLRSLGATRADLARVGILRGAFMGAVAAVVATSVAIAGSVFMPIGPLRTLEPHRGVDIDFTVVASGAVALILLLAAYEATGALRHSARDTVRQHRFADAVAGSSASPPVVTGVRFALDPGRGDATIPLRSTAFGVGLAIAALVATIVYASGLAHFTSTPRMYGWVWSYQVEPANDATVAGLEHQAAALRHDTHVHAAAVAAYAQLAISGKTIGAVAVQRVPGIAVTQAVRGREPQQSHDLAVGAETLRSLHRHVGDAVDVTVGSVTRRFAIVGQAVFPRFAPYPASEPTGLGVGVAMTLDGLARFGPLDNAANSPVAATPFMLVDATKGTPASFFVDKVFDGHSGNGLVLPAQRPNYVATYQHLEGTPLALAGLLVVLALASMVHLLVSMVRRRRRDLGVLRALGFTSGQLRVSVLVQATTLVGLTLVVAIPAGVLGGRALWALTSNWLGIPVHDVVPLALIMLVVATALLAGNGVALFPAAQAARVNPAEILHVE